MRRVFHLFLLAITLPTFSFSHAENTLYWSGNWNPIPPLYRTPLEACQHAFPGKEVAANVTYPGGGSGAGSCSVMLNGQWQLLGWLAATQCGGSARYFDDVLLCVALSPIPDNTKDTGPCDGPCVGNPINPGNSNKWQRERDYAAATPTGELSLLRTYNSSPSTLAATTIRSFGSRWMHRYDAALTREPDRLPGVPLHTCWRRTDNNDAWCEYPAAINYSAIPQTVSSGALMVRNTFSIVVSDRLGSAKPT